jgi:hypothetical protein
MSTPLSTIAVLEKLKAGEPVTACEIVSSGPMDGQRGQEARTAALVAWILNYGSGLNPSGPPTPTTISLNGVEVDSVDGDIPQFWQLLESPNNVNNTFDSIEFGNNVKIINQFAFYNCELLSGLVTIPEGVTHIGREAFAFCENIQAIKLPNSLQHIGVDAFVDCNSITQLRIPANVHTLEDECFDSMDNLESVVFLGEDCSMYNPFQSCINLTTVVLPSELTALGYYAFSNCNNLTSINLPNTLTYLDDGVFQGTLIESITLPDSITHFGDWLFSGTYITNISGIIFPESLTRFPNGAFAYSYSLTEAVIQSHFTSIGADAFAYCTVLSSVELPPNLESIDNAAFQSCAILEITIPDSCNSIGASAFANCGGLSSVTLPSDLEILNEGVFAYCQNLQNITFPDNLMVIRQNAFYSTGVNSVILPSSLTTVNAYAFYSCQNLYYVIFKENVSLVLQYSFAYCPQLFRVYVECNAGAFSPQAFEGSPVQKIYYKAGTLGWNEEGDNMWAGIPTEVWATWPNPL